MPASGHNPKVDAYIEKAKPFAQPILVHLRKVVHAACPAVEETIKWGRPFFEYKGAILGNMSAFKEHCSFGFWGEEIGAVLRKAGAVRGRRNGLSWPHHQRRRLCRRKNNSSPGSARPRASSTAATTPAPSPPAAKSSRRPNPRSKLQPNSPWLSAKTKRPQPAFAAFSPSCKREYIEWIADAKRPETRDQRIATAVEWIAEGKQRNWKYQK